MMNKILEYLTANFIDILALVASFLAFFFSIKTHKDNKKLSEKGLDISIKELNRRFFDEIYFSFLTDVIPRKIEKFDSIDRNALDSSIELESIFYDIMSKSLFYKYFDNKFYEKLKDIVLDLQTIIFDISDSLTFYLNSTSDDLATEYAENYRELKNIFFSKLEDLYLLFRNYYSGY